MRNLAMIAFCVGCAALVSACGKGTSDADVERSLKDLDVIDDSNMSDLMLRSASPTEAVSYFRRAAGANPDRIDLQRGLGQSLIRANQPVEAASVLRKVVDLPGSVPEDRVLLADALIRGGDWDGADATLDTIPPTYETFSRYRLEAMVADSDRDWKKADSFYEIALGLTTQPSGVLNNWGYSKLTRGEFTEAERLFGQALTYDPDMFTAKNNLVLARGSQRRYDLPVVRMTQVERAQLLHTMGLAAIKQGDVATGKGLLRQALETHPQHFEAAARSLDALEASVAN